MRHEMRAVLPETDRGQAGDALFKIAPGASLCVAPNAKSTSVTLRASWCCCCLIISPKATKNCLCSRKGLQRTGIGVVFN